MAKKEKKVKRKLKKWEKWYKFWRGFVYGVFCRPFFRLKKYGHTEYFPDGAYLIVGNHLSVLDVLPPAFASKSCVHYMAKKEIFEGGLLAKIARGVEAIPVNRDGNDVRAVMTAMKYLKEGEIVCCYPEGTRNKTQDQVLLPFKSGATALAIKTKTPIIPIVQVKPIKMFHVTHALYGDAFEFSEYYDKKLTQEDIEKCDEFLRQKIEGMYYELKEILAQKGKKKKKKNKE